jgi:hypothetical protein
MSDNFLKMMKWSIVVSLLICQCLYSAPLPGQIMVDPDNPAALVYNHDRDGDGKRDPFFMCGAGDPEGFLYFGTRNSDGTVNGTKQMEILNNMKASGGNAIYMIAVRTHGGDAQAFNDPDWAYENPFIDGDPGKGLDQDILNQWETWFRVMDSTGIVIFFIFYDDGALPFASGDNIPSGEVAMIKGIVNKFEHHKHLIWCIAEEYYKVLSRPRVSRMAALIRAEDDHDHVISIHQATGDKTMDFPDDPNIDQFAFQAAASSHAQMYTDVKFVFENAKGRYHINMAENWTSRNNDHMVLIANLDRQGVRQRNWAAAMAGGHVMVLGTWNTRRGNEPTPEILGDMRVLQEFFESTNYSKMAPRDDLKGAGTQYLLADPGKSYIAYGLNSTGPLGIKNMAAGDYELTWLDIISGTKKNQTQQVSAGDCQFIKPSGIGTETALFIRKMGTTGLKHTGIKKKSEFKIRAYPNPFNSRTAIKVEGNGNGKQSNIDFKIFNINGKMIKELAPRIPNSSFVIRNSSTFYLQAVGLSMGTYFLNAKLGKQMATQRISIIK